MEGPPAKKPRLSSTDKQEKALVAMAELKRNPLPSLLDILQRIADADARKDIAAVASGANILKEFLAGKTTVAAYGRRDLEDEVGSKMRQLMLPVVEEAKKSREKRLKFPSDVIIAWRVIRDAGRALTKLNRAKKYNDGKYAFQLLWPYVTEAINLFITYADEFDSITDLYTITGRLYEKLDYDSIFEEARIVNEKSALTKEDVERITELKKSASREFVQEMTPSLALAVSKCRKEQKNSVKMAREAGEKESDFGRSCCRLAQLGYGIEAGGDDLGFDLFMEARDELQEWKGDSEESD